MATAYMAAEDGLERPAPDEALQRRLYEAARPIIDRLSRLADKQVRSKSLIEQRWLDDLRMYFARLEERTLAGLTKEGRSTVFVGLTRHKTNSWSARLGDLLFPTDSENWGIEPTPIPKLARQAQAAIKQAQAAVEAANAAQDPEQQARVKDMAESFATAARQTRGEIDEAKKRCKRMQETIKDQLVEADYVAQCRDVIEDGCRLGTGILKGPITSQRLRAQWRAENGIWSMVQIPDPHPDFRRVDPWHFFPDMSATKMQEAEFTFERHLPTAKDLRRHAMKLGFNKHAVRTLLKEGPRPLGLEIDHLAQLRAITGEGDPITERYVMWEYHGPLECEEIAMLLRAMGNMEKAEQFETEKDPLEEYRVILHFCNDEVLRIVPEYPLESGDSLYSVWNFEKGETSVFGIGVPNIMSDSQRAVNGAWRMIMDNAALAAAPQVVINRNAIASQDGSWNLKAHKSWLLNSTAGVNLTVPAFQIFEIPLNTDLLLKIIETGKIFIDEETGMPQIAQGEQGAASTTLGGMSMLFNSANVIFRRIVKSWDDDLTKPTIRRAYDWNMQFNPDEAVKGDMQVDARGSSVLLVREIQSQLLMNIMTNWTTHPVLGPWIMPKVRSGLEKTLQTMMISPDDMLASQEEYDENLRKQQEAEAEEGGETDPNAIRLQIAQLQAATSEKIENMRMEIAIAKLSAETGQSEQEIRAKYGIEEMKVGATERVKQAEIGSKERIKAVEIAKEDERAAQAREEGRSEVEAVGEGIG